MENKAEPGVKAHETSRATRLSWPFPRLSSETVLAIGLLLLALCLYPFWGTISVAAIFAFGLKEPLLKMRERLNLGRKLTDAIAVTGLLLALLLPTMYLGLRLYQVAAGQGRGEGRVFSAQTTSKITEAYKRVEEAAASYGKRFNVYESTADARLSIQENLANAGRQAVGNITGALLGIPDLVVGLIIFALFFYLFLAKGAGIGEGLVQLGVVPKGDLELLIETFQKSCREAIVTNMVLGCMQASIVAVGARFCGYREMAVIFTITFFLSFIPIIGAAPVAFFLSGVSFLTENTGAGIALLAIGGVTGSVDNLLRPYLISSGEGEGHPILSFATIIGAILIFGLKGLFVGPVIIMTTFVLLKKLRAART
jgi:predicted PurR-regulated permease PerM